MGITARLTWPSGRPKIPQLTNRQIPKGGVTIPTARLTTINTPKWIGSMLICGVRVARTGTRRIRAAVSAAAEPEIPAKSMEATITAHASPPGTQPTRLSEKSINWREMPPVSMMEPVNMNSGMASRSKESTPANRSWMIVCPGRRSEHRPERPPA